MKKLFKFFVFSFIFWNAIIFASDFQFYPGASYNPNIPTLKQIVGHDWGEKITSHAEMEHYIKALTESSPKVQAFEYGQTWEGRKLYYLIIASETNMSRIEDIKTGIQKLADPRKITRAEANQLIQSLPAITWLAYAVHGNETSSTEAALLTAYHLAAAENDTVAKIVLQNSLVIIDPLQNPDGRDRFVNYFRQTRGRWPDPDQQAAEHNEDWPGGRTNHYLFDLNRDWFPQTQMESHGKVKAFLEWYPQVYADLHEMGSNSTYYFPPTPLPRNPNVTDAQLDWLETFGRNNAKWFDRMQFDYFSREVFDAFYPGYGVSWPTFHGAMGMTYEQASTRGLLVKRNDETTMNYRDAVQHHFISSLATAETAARNQEALLRYFYDYRQSAIKEGSQEQIKEFILAPGPDANRTAKLASILIAQGIEVKQAEKSFTNSKVRDYYKGNLHSEDFPAGTYIVSMAQPAKRLAKVLLAKNTPMDPSFIKEQLRRYEKHLNDQIYDITAWSLPLLYDVECYMTEVPSRGQFKVLNTPLTPKGRFTGEKAHLAYLIPWGTNSAAKALGQILQNGLNVFSSDKSFKLNGQNFPSGTLIIKVKNNPADLHERLAKIAEKTGVEIVPTNTAWVEEGVNFGSGNVRYLEKPKIALAYHLPTHPYSTGWARYLLEQAYQYPVTIFNTMQFGRLDLSKYNVLILPNSRSFYGGYNQTLGGSGISKIKSWIQNGGTLITIGEATRWLTDEKVGLLATHRELKGGQPDKPPKKDEKTTKPQGAQKESTPKAGKGAAKPFDLKKAIQPEKELPPATPGTIMRITLDTEHWLAFGYDGDTNVMVSSRNIFTPIKLDKGRNIGLYMPEDRLLVSGFTWLDAQKQIANKAYLMYQRYGQGHVVAFTEDPNFRAFMDGLNLLFLNAVFFGPGH